MKKYKKEYDYKYHNISEWMQIHEKFLKQRIDNISDRIAVYNLDKTIIFCNEAWYKYYNKKPEEVNGNKWCDAVVINKECSECFHEKAIITKETQRIEKYIKELGKYVEIIYKPIVNYSDDVICVFKSLKEISEKEFLENKLKKSREEYEEIFNIFPEPVLIIVDNKIVLANEMAQKYRNDIIGKAPGSLVINYKNIIERRLNQILTCKKNKAVLDYKVLLDNGKAVNFEVSSSYILYKGKPAILSIFKDITKMKRSLNSVAKVQKMALQEKFPIDDKGNMEVLYVPARTVSGDFYHINKVDEDAVVGIIGDVKGKGITAAVNISACNVLFNEAILISKEPKSIIDYLNNKIINYLGDSYIAACCFKLDFKNKKAVIVGAGINEFVFQNNNGFEKTVVRGPFLGMFETSTFDEITIEFTSKDKFYFYTDGLDFIFEEKIEKELCKFSSIKDVTNYLNHSLIDMLTGLNGLKDDCTLIALEMK